jgi:hypothetical protein
MPAFHAPENSHLGNFYFTSLDAEGETFYKRLSHFVPGRFNDSSEGLA